MQPTSKSCHTLNNNALIDTKNNAKAKPSVGYFRVTSQASKRLSLLSIFIAVTVLATPLYAQAALPAAIQAALSRAELSASDISMVITPVGDKNASHLPSPIQVIDSSDSAETEAAFDSKSVKQNSTQNAKHDGKNNSSPQVTLTTIEKRTIKKHEQKIHAYTDDPYTYQSLESIPTLIPDSHHSASQSVGNQAVLDNGSMGAADNHTNTAASAIKISFSPLLSHQPDTPRTPASTMKLVPSFIALDTLGADFVWHTRVYHTGLVIGDRLYGDLIIQGSGDPKMTHERLKQLLYQVQTSDCR